MLIDVSMNGKRLFEWEGDVDAIARIDNETQRIAEIGNITPQVLWQSALLAIDRHGGGLCSPNPEAEMMVVMWGLISAPTHDPNHPGLVRDYLGKQDYFGFNIYVD